MLMKPLPRLPCLASSEEPQRRARAIEDFKKKRKHTLLDLGDWKSASGGNKLEGAAHQVRVALGDELYPRDRGVWLETLSRRRKRDKPVLVDEPAGTEGTNTKFLRRGRGTLSRGCRSGRGDLGSHG